MYLGGTHDAYPYNLVIVPGNRAAYGHAVFEVADESSLDRACAALDDAGVAIDEIVDLPWKRSIFLTDPDGLASEWTVRRDAPRALDARGAVSLLRAA